jgi:hypothetical protein
MEPNRHPRNQDSGAPATVVIRGEREFDVGRLTSYRCKPTDAYQAGLAHAVPAGRRALCRAVPCERDGTTTAKRRCRNEEIQRLVTRRAPSRQGDETSRYEGGTRTDTEPRLWLLPCFSVFTRVPFLAALKKGAAKKKHGAYVVVGFHPTTTYSTLISAENPFFSRVVFDSCENINGLNGLTRLAKPKSVKSAQSVDVESCV